jgi:formate dehydrogenase
VLAILYKGDRAAVEEPRLLGTVENEVCAACGVRPAVRLTTWQLGLRKWLEEQGHELVVTHDKEGSESVFQKHLVDVRASHTVGAERNADGLRAPG